jgi:hypothetical protein
MSTTTIKRWQKNVHAKFLSFHFYLFNIFSLFRYNQDRQSYGEKNLDEKKQDTGLLQDRDRITFRERESNTIGNSPALEARLERHEGSLAVEKTQDHVTLTRLNKQNVGVAQLTLPNTDFYKALDEIVDKNELQKIWMEFFDNTWELHRGNRRLDDSN